MVCVCVCVCVHAVSACMWEITNTQRQIFYHNVVFKYIEAEEVATER